MQIIIVVVVGVVLIVEWWGGGISSGGGVSLIKAHQQTNPPLDSTGEDWTAIPESQLLLARYLTG